MAYCKSCGAYIPDGQTKCLACGYDESPEPVKPEKSSGSAFAYQDHNAELRERLERQREEQMEAQRRLAEQEYARRKQQEESRRWAEEEAAKRRKQEENRRWAEEEYARRQKEKKAEEPTRSFSAEGSTVSNKLIAALSYLSILCLLPAFLTPNDEYARFHGRQGLRLLIFGAVLDAVGWIPGIGWLGILLRLYLIYKGMDNALNGRKLPLPWIGTFGK